MIIIANPKSKTIVQMEYPSQRPFNPNLSLNAKNNAKGIPTI